jgi:hypothetical protein
MRPRSNGTIIRAAFVAGSAVLLGCEGTDAVVPDHQHPGNPSFAQEISGDIKSDVARLRALVAPLHALDKARDAGFSTQASPCMALPPTGGMGYHWRNNSRVDATVKWDEPEVVVFSPATDEKDGVKLGAVEYIVPRALVAEAPTLFGQTFIPGGPGNALWTLHVWIGIDNPSGLFAPWNPRVSCD